MKTTRMYALWATGSMITHLGIVSAFAASNTEPAYCDPAAFARLEIASPDPQIQRLHLYRLGSTLLAGLDVGASDPGLVALLATQGSQGRAGPAQQYCTWYLNGMKAPATRYFKWKPLPFPGGDPAKISATTFAILESSIATDPLSWLSCAEEAGYVAMGCYGMMHRGPGAFGMLLSISGCTAEHAYQIVTTTWGSNGVPSADRLAIIQTGYNYGLANPDIRARFQRAFTIPLIPARR